MNKLFKIENGDFQTPQALTDKVCNYIWGLGLRPKTIIEPTCGLGSFIQSAIERIHSAKKIIGFDINSKYISSLKEKLRFIDKLNIVLETQDFFTNDWDSLIRKQDDPIMFIGNLPWVTNSKIGSIKGTNLPQKNNFLKFNGFDALTGKSNFDISEWMLIKISNVLSGKKGYLAILCKTTVARKILNYCWKNNLPTTDSRVIIINAREGFDVSVDACLLYIHFNPSLPQKKSADVFPNFDASRPVRTIGYKEGLLISDLNLYHKNKSLLHAIIKHNQWRTGIKHDCSRVMELTKKEKDVYINGLGEESHLEEEAVYPLMKSSDVSNNKKPNKWVIVTQKKLNEETSHLKQNLPLLWSYLTKHNDYFSKRASKIYSKRPQFAVFGIGPYTFLPWKIAISGFYKSTNFRLVGPYLGKSVLFDDTVNFLAYRNKERAEKDLKRLNSKPVRELFESLIFWDSKRPITTSLLNLLVKR